MRYEIGQLVSYTYCGQYFIGIIIDVNKSSSKRLEYDIMWFEDGGVQHLTGYTTTRLKYFRDNFINFHKGVMGKDNEKI